MPGPFGTDDDETAVGGKGEPAPKPSPGDSTRYRLKGVLGEGGMATILEAEDTRIGRIVAIKRLKDSHAHDPDMRARFEREVRILAGMAHPGLVPVYEAGRLEGGDPYFAMQKVRGRTLAEILRGRDAAQVRDRAVLMHLVDIFERVCLAIAYAHGRRILHRDLKPTNVMVDDAFGVVYVMDWGLAKRLPGPEGPGDEPSIAGVVMGTPGYMSPEQVKGLAEADDMQTDVFALGAILYEILTGKRPFQGDRLTDLLEETARHDPPPPVTVNPRCGRELSAICMKALSKDPARRYPTARELADDVRRYREFLPVSVVRPRLFDRVGNWARRHRAPAGAAAAALVALIGTGTWLGIASYTRHRTIAWAMQLAEEERHLIRDLEEKIYAVKDRIERSGDPAERRRLLEVDLPELRGELRARHYEMRGYLAAVIGYTFPHPDRRAVEMAREQIFLLANKGLAAGEYHVVAALIASALDGYEADNVLGFSAEEALELEMLLARARESARRERAGVVDDALQDPVIR